jgi:hypothetical protein
MNKWRIGQNVSLAWETKLVKKNRNNSYERMIGSNYICIREATDGHYGILLRVLDKARASSIKLVRGQPFFLDECTGLFEGYSFSSYSSPSLAELKEVLAILRSNQSLLDRFEEAKMPISLQSLFWVNETARNILFMKKPLCYDPSTDSLCIASDPVEPCRLTMVYFNSQLQIVDFVTDQSDAATAEAGKLVQQASDVAWKKWVLPAALSLAAAFYGGYLTGEYSNNQKDIHPASVEKVLAKDSVSEKKAPVKDSVPEKKVPVKESVPEKKAPVKENVAPSHQKDSVASDQYEAKDIRVRTGAYRIIGTDRVVTVKAGDNVTRIANRTLGPGMECYIEVLNDMTSRTKLKAGQTIKIPKLERKRKTKSAAKQ